ncbi:hypothetical protein WJX73_005470 [Symbiochloris irregularis]|uniref:Uncharacterized protein n=1 Tax=Symbiochloris irregularis TaxID=706552 RepID=A0AAW1PA78_9CHLO
MIRGPAAVEAVATIQRLQLFAAVFQAPPTAASLLGPDYGLPCLAVMTAAAQLLDAIECKAQQPAFEEDERCMALMAALLLPLRSATVSMGKGSKKGAPLAAWIIKEAIKWPNKDTDGVTLLHSLAPGLLDISNSLQAGVAAEGEQGWVVRAQLGQVLRRLGKAHLLRPGLVVASLLSMPEARPLGVQHAAGSSPEAAHSPGPTSSQTQDDSASRLECYNRLDAAMASFGLQGCWDWRPLLDGKEVMQAANLTKGGPELGKLTGLVLDFQLSHPQATKEDAIAWLQQQINEAPG